jgi:TonB family protein
VDDKVIACCAPDLAATGKDGVCDCAPGGAEPDAGASSCRRAKQTGVSGAESVVQAIRPRLRACYEQGLAKNESLAGSMVIGLEIAPDGRVYRGRIKEGRMASPIVQRCVLDELRKARFEPPAGGSSAMEIPVRFEQRGEDDATSIPGRHPCREKGTCAADAKAWCDADEKELACCAPGLVAVSRDGVCDCPPGGVTSPVGNCPRATTTKREYDAALHEGAISKPLMECIFAADAGSVGGTLKMHVTYDPDGRIGDVRVTRGALPQVFAQRCVLDAVRALKAPPPPDGTWTSDVSLQIQPPPKK